MCEWGSKLHFYILCVKSEISAAVHMLFAFLIGSADRSENSWPPSTWSTKVDRLRLFSASASIFMHNCSLLTWNVSICWFVCPTIACANSHCEENAPNSQTHPTCSNMVEIETQMAWKWNESQWKRFPSRLKGIFLPYFLCWNMYNNRFD